MGNLLIKNGMIIDGTGRDAFKGDVVVAKDRIESVISSNTPSGKDSAAPGTDTVIVSTATVILTGCCRCPITRNFFFP